ncbi:transposase [Pseudolactococcus insecticola]|uniref:Transposase n=1 Tax=Pseudolactococcus insecticola TaxID=2709158 RepID=A0A6A0B9Y1_9LACT|nr:transposase [Lactococcus insecticola]GFH41261.1 transposase [Lactococcus insecticola]
MQKLKAFKLRLYPNASQREQIDITINHSRYVWNEMLEMQKARYKNNKNAKFINTFGMNSLLTVLKQELKWLNEADSTALQETNQQLNDAYKRFFKKLGGHPHFKSRKFGRKSYTTKMGMSLIDDKHLKLAKLGAVYFKAKAIPNGKIKRVTVRISPTGKYYAMVLAETEIKPYDTTGKSVGVDLGLADLAIQSDEYKLPNIRFDKQLAKKKLYWEVRLARRRNRAIQVIHNTKKLTGQELTLDDFSNYARAKHMIAKYSEKIANQRLDYLHKYTTQLVKNYDVIAIEKLQASKMMKNHKLARAIANASWYKLSEMLAYKTEWYCKTLIKIDPSYTTQVDYETQEVIKHDLSVRKYTNSFGHLIDRDINAAKNILEWASDPEKHAVILEQISRNKTRVTKA